MRKSISMVSLILCATFINAQQQPPIQNTTIPDNQTIIVNNSTQSQNPNNTTQSENPMETRFVVDNSTNTFSENNSTSLAGVSVEDLNDFRTRDEPDDWILTWNVLEEDFNKCKRELEVCCYNAGVITPEVVKNGDKKSIQFSGIATGKNCPQDGKLVITLTGLTNHDELEPIGNGTTGTLYITNNMQGSNTEQTPEQLSFFFNDVSPNSTLQQNNSTQQDIPLGLREVTNPPVEHIPPPQLTQQPRDQDFFAIFLPSHPNNNTKKSCLNVLRLINEQNIYSSINTDSSTSGKMLQACVFAFLTLVISI